MRLPRCCWLLLLVLLLGCSSGDSGANLLNVQNVAPRHVDLGDRVELVGAGFPEGRAATVTFRGELRRSGGMARDGRIVAEAAASTPDKVSITIDRRLQEQFCGVGDAAQHTTFHGEVTVAFAPRRAGAPPVTGVLHDVLLDVEAPAPSRRIAAERDAETRRALEFMGLGLAPESGSDRLRIESIRRGSPAERAGLLVADTLISVDGVSVYAQGDVVPARGSRFSRVVVRRGRLAQPLEHRLDVEGFHSRAPIELLPVAVGLAVPVLLLLLLRSRIGAGLLLLSRIAASKLRARPRAGERWRPRSMLERQVAVPEWRALPYLVFLAVSAAFTVIAFGQYLVAPDLDLGLACLGSTTALLVVAVLSGGAAEPGRFSLRAGFERAWQALGHQLPPLLAVAGTVLASGSLRLSDAVSLQGALPWQWRAVDGPAAAVALSLSLLALLPCAPRSGPRWLQGAAAAAEWANLLVMAGLLVSLFLGGWNVPLITDSPRPWGRAAGAALLQLKCWALICGALLVRWLLPGLETRATARWCWRWAVPLAAGCLAVTLLWDQWAPPTLARELDSAARWLVLGTALAAAAVVAQRLRGSLRRPQLPLAVNPWL